MIVIMGDRNLRSLFCEMCETDRRADLFDAYARLHELLRVLESAVDDGFKTVLRIPGRSRRQSDLTTEEYMTVMGAISREKDDIARSLHEVCSVLTARTGALYQQRSRLLRPADVVPRKHMKTLAGVHEKMQPLRGYDMSDCDGGVGWSIGANDVLNLGRAAYGSKQAVLDSLGSTIARFIEGRGEVFSHASRPAVHGAFDVHGRVEKMAVRIALYSQGLV